MKMKRGGRKEKLKTQAEELADSNGNNVTGELTVGAKSCNSEIDGSCADGNFGGQFRGAPDGRIPEAAKVADMQQKYGDMLGKKGTLKVLEAELARKDCWSYSKESNKKDLEREEQGRMEKEREE